MSGDASDALPSAAITAVGLACGAGRDFATATAAYAAGMAGPKREMGAIGPDGSPPILAACLPFAKPRDAVERLCALFAAALSDAMIASALSERQPLPVVILVPRWAPQTLRAMLTQYLPPHWPDVRFVQGANSSSLGLLGHAAKAVALHRIPGALVCVVDSLVNADRMDVLMINGAMLGNDTPYGVVPGEAAVAVLLAPATVTAGFGYVREVRSAVEVPLKAGELRGRQIARCLRELAPAMAAHPQPGRLLTDLAGPRARAEAFGFAAATSGPLIGSLARLPEAPSLALGDMGEATGLALTALALACPPRTYPDDDVCLVVTTDQPAAAVLERV